MPEFEGLEYPYEAPRVESVLTAEELTREILYAGDGTLVVDGGAQ